MDRSQVRHAQGVLADRSAWMTGRLKGALAAVCALLALSFSLVGCAAMAAEQAGIGEQDGSAAAFAVTNSTGKDIEAIYFKRAGDAKYGAALAQDGLFADGQTTTVHVPASSDTRLDMQFATNDGAAYELKKLKVGTIKDAVLKLSGDATSCYIEYTDAASGKTVSILESEQVAKEKAAAAKKATAEAKAAKKEAAEAKREAKKAASATSSTSSYSGSSSASSASSSSAGSSAATSSKSSKNTSGSKKSNTSTSTSSSSKGSSSKSSQSSASSAPADTEDDRCIEL